MKYNLPSRWPQDEADEAKARKTAALKKLFEAKERQRKHKEARGEVERAYCLGCRVEMPTESGQVCQKCGGKQ